MVEQRAVDADKIWSDWSQWLAILGALIAIGLIVFAVSGQVNSIRSAILSDAIERNQFRVAMFEKFVQLGFDNLEAEIAYLERSNSSSLLKEADDDIIGVIRERSGQISFGQEVSFSRSQTDKIERYVLSHSGFLSPPFETIDGKKVLFFSANKGTAGRSQPRVILVVRPDYFLRFADETEFARGDLISLIGLDGITRARRTFDQISTGEDLSGALVMEQQQKEPDGTYEGANGLTGEQSVFSHRRIEDYAVFATSGLEIDRVNEEARAQSRFHWIMLAIALLIIVVALWVVVRVLRQQRLHLRLLSKSLKRLQDSQRLGGIGDWEFDVESQTFTISESLKDAYGLRDDVEVSIDKFSSSLDDESKHLLRKELYEVMTFGHPRSFELTLSRPGHEQSVREIVVGPQYSSSGQVVMLGAIDRDITRERKIGALRARLSVLSRLDAMSALAATIAHELSQPLSAARALLTAANKVLRDGETERALTLCEQSHSQLRFMSEIVSNARSELQSWGDADETFEIGEAVVRTKELLGNFYGAKQFKIHFENDRHSQFARGSLSQAKQVFFNLFKNSIEASGSDVRCEIFVRAEPVIGGMIQVTVKDNGPGVDIGGDPFALFASNKRDGLGLGMAITKTVVEALGGEIWIGRPEEGATICFTLQAAPAHYGRLEVSNR